MPVSYSTDLHWRAVWLVTLRNLTYEETGEMLYMSGKSVQRYVTAFLTTGNVEPVKQRHGPERMLSDFEQVIVMQLLIDKPSAYLSCSNTFMILQGPGFMYQQSAVPHTALDTPESVYNTLLSNVVMTSEHSTWQKFHCTLVWVDESGFQQRNSIRAYDYSLRGLRAEDHQFKVGKARINVIGVMSYQGVEDVHLTEDNVNGDIFEHFVGSCLLPILMPFNGVNTHSVVVMDNCSVHHLDSVGARQIPSSL